MVNHMLEIFGSVLVALITAFFGPIAIMWVKRKFTKPVDSLKVELNQIEKINLELEEVLNHLGCDRVWVTQIHNGGHFLHSNKSMQKFSVMYEVNSPGVSSVSSIFTNMPISLYSRFIGICDYHNPEVATYGLKPAAEATGAKASYILGLFDFGTGKLMGTIGIDFLESTHMNDTKIDYFREKGERLAGYLSVHNNK